MLEHIGFVDDVQGKITYTYRDGSSSTEDIDIPGENDVKFFTDAHEKQIASVAVRFNGSGAISGLRFKEVEEADPIPEPSAALGLVAFGAVVTRFKRQRQGATS
ncbi:MAG: hypothetical protein F6K42_15395 [Leptolyngbya sp. SIO1D8]|nr:hypothetical protein [Leptolyngbya sp. SIO1D8]